LRGEARECLGLGAGGNGGMGALAVLPFGIGLAMLVMGGILGLGNVWGKFFLRWSTHRRGPGISTREETPSLREESAEA
jgi:hypothetical protein